MKAYKIELFIIDFDEVGPDDIKTILTHTKYPNWCISPHVMSVKEKDIGEWRDDHPLNKNLENEYQKLFSEDNND